MPKLVYIDPESDQEVTVEINEEKPEISIGRNPGNIVRVNNPSISRQHARVVFENGQCTLIDLDSSNGSYINGNRIRSQVLVDGDRIRVGEFPVDYMAQLDEATYEVDQDVIDELQREMQVPSNGDIRRQTAIGGFEAEPPEDQHWGAPPAPDLNDPATQQDDAFAFVDSQPAPAMDGQEAEGPHGDPSGPISLSMDVIEEIDEAEELSVDDDAILEELPVDDVDLEELSDEQPFAGENSESHLDTYNAPPDEIAHSLRALDQASAQEFEQEPTVEGDAVAAAAEVMGASPATGVPAIPGDVDDDASTREVVPDDIEAQLQAVIAERDELAELLESRAGDAGGASQVQIERLRKERDRLIEERRNLKRQIGDLQRQSQDAPDADEFESTLAELNEANDSITALEVKVEDLSAELEDRADEVASLETEREMLRAQLAEAESAAEEGASLGERLSDAEQIVQKAEQDLQSAQQRVAELEEELDSSREEVQQLVADLEARDMQVAELEAGLTDSNNALAERDDALETMNTEVEAARATVAELEAQVERLETELESRPVADEIAQIHEDLVAARAQVESLTEERDELVARRDELEHELNEARGLYDTLEERNAELSQDLEDTTRERDALKHEKGAFARETDYLQVEKRKLDSEVRKLRKEMKKLNKQDKRKKQIFDELSGDLKNLVKENTELQGMIEDLDAQVRNAPSADELAAAQQRAKDLENETAELRKQVAEMEGDTEAMTRELGSISEERDRLNEQVESLQSDLEHANKTLEALRETASEGEELNARVVELEVQVENLSHDLEQARTEADAAKEQAEQASQEAEKVASDAEQAVEQSEKQLEKLKKKLEDAEATAAELILQKDRLEDELKSKS